MSDEISDEIKDNILSPSQWLRILFMLGYVLLCWFILAPVIMVLVVVQMLVKLITGKTNKNLYKAAKLTTLYCYQILEFITYCRDDKPFPFSAWPEFDDQDAHFAAADEFTTENEAEDAEPSRHSAPSTVKESDAVTLAAKAELESAETLTSVDADAEEIAPESSLTNNSHDTKSIDEQPLTNEELETLQGSVNGGSSSNEVAAESEDDVFADMSFTTPEADPDNRNSDNDATKQKKPE